MIEFNPDDELETQEQADAYIEWCADQFVRISEGFARTYRTGVRCAHWLLVVAGAQLHLDDGWERDREALLEQLALYTQLGRALERQREEITVERLIVYRSSLDCWEPVGRWAWHLLNAARCAISALILIEMHPLVDLWDLECQDVWSLLAAGSDCLTAINLDEDLGFEDFAIRPHEDTIAKFTWQRANNLHRKFGLPPLSAN